VIHNHNEICRKSHCLKIVTYSQHYEPVWKVRKQLNVLWYAICIKPCFYSVLIRYFNRTYTNVRVVYITDHAATANGPQNAVCRCGIPKFIKGVIESVKVNHWNLAIEEGVCDIGLTVIFSSSFVQFFHYNRIFVRNCHFSILHPFYVPRKGNLLKLFVPASILIWVPVLVALWWFLSPRCRNVTDRRTDIRVSTGGVE